jgi:hypothetical protein
MFDTERLSLPAHFKMTGIYNGGSGISSALIRAVPTTPVISAHTARARYMLGFEQNILEVYVRTGTPMTPRSPIKNSIKRLPETLGSHEYGGISTHWALTARLALRDVAGFAR